MSFSITGAIPAASYAAPDTAPPAAPQTQTQPIESPAFVVQLTAAEQAFQLSQQGQTVPQIATALNLPVPVVNNYLGIAKPA